MTINKSKHQGSRAKAVKVTAASATLALALSSCAGQVDAESEDLSNEEAGVEVGATAEEYQEALADMPETTLVVQSAATSENALLGDVWTNFQDNVEELSGGKINIDLVWSQSIATYPEIEAALLDGRLDIAYHIPHYDPASYPVHSAFVTATTMTGASPRAEELAANAALTEVAGGTPALIEEFEDKGLHPLLLTNPAGTVFNMCTEPGATVEDWNGLQTRVPSSTHESQVQALGGNPVSLDHLETFEALQRNTIDCSIGAALVAAVGGTTEITPHVQYTEASSFARPPATIMGGTGYGDLPLAAQQLIFDQMEGVFRDWRVNDLRGNILVAEEVREHSGTYEKIDDELEDALIENSLELLDEHIAEGLLDESIKNDLPEALEKWRNIVDEMGLGDEGGFDDIDQWHDEDEVDLGPFSERVFEEAFIQYRPQ